MPDKTLNQLLQEYAQSPEADNRSRNRAAFRTYEDEIMAALATGWSMRKIWKVLAKDGRIAFSYSVFTEYVKQARNIRKTEP